jgi:hypothetical protein
MSVSPHFAPAPAPYPKNSRWGGEKIVGGEARPIYPKCPIFFRSRVAEMQQCRPDATRPASRPIAPRPRALSAGDRRIGGCLTSIVQYSTGRPLLQDCNAFAHFAINRASGVKFVIDLLAQFGRRAKSVASRQPTPVAFRSHPDCWRFKPGYSPDSGFRYARGGGVAC